jgi:hypothetical protein
VSIAIDPIFDAYGRVVIRTPPQRNVGRWERGRVALSMQSDSGDTPAELRR